jgi:tetratricopeptide (TPR) repeat protein
LRSKLAEARSFLGALIDLYWPDSLYELAEPKARFKGTLLAFKTLIEAESLRQPVILQIEDAHWLDVASNALIAFLTQGAERFPWGLLITSRYHEDGTSFTIGLGEHIPQKTLVLNPLSVDAIHALASQVMEESISPDLANLIMSKAGGNPLFIEQLTLDMRERGFLIRGEDGLWNINHQIQGEVPDTINAVLVAQLDRLPPQLKTIVQVAAVLSQPVELPVLAHMLGNSIQPIDIGRQLEEAAIWSMLDSSRAEFQHTLLRDTAYEMQLQSRLCELHSQAGKAIEAIHQTELNIYAADLAYHYSKAGDHQLEQRFARLAGEVAAARFANAEASTYLTRALELTSQTNEMERYELLLTRESVFDLQGDRSRQIQDLDDLMKLADRMDDDRRRAQVTLKRANFAEVTSDYRGALTAAKQAVLLAQNCKAVEIESSAWLAQGRALGWQGHYESAIECLKHSLDMSSTYKLTGTESDALRNLGIVAYAQGDYEAARNYQASALNLSREIGDRRGESNALNNLSQIARDQSDYATARSYQEQALRLSRETGDRRGENSALNATQVAMMQQGYQQKLDFYTNTLQLSRDIGNRRGESVALRQLGTLALEHGDHTSAKDLLEQSLNISREINLRRGEIEALILMGRLFQEIENYAAALDHAEQALKIALEVGAKQEQIQASIILGHALLGSDELARAGTAYEQAVRWRSELGHQSPSQEILAGLAQVALLQENLNEARILVDKILKRLRLSELDTIDETQPLQVYLTCFRILHVSRDPRAKSVLDAAHQILQFQLSKIEDYEHRRMFLEKIPTHRAVAATWAWSNYR